MRTTVTIDPDTELLIKEAVQNSGLSFKEVLNRSVRRGLSQAREVGAQATVRPLFPAPFPPELLEGSLNHLAEAWDDEDTLHELGA